MSAETPNEVSLRLEPRQTVVKEDDEIGIVAVFLAGAQEAMLILPLGADASGIISFRAVDMASGREWTATNRDARSFAADAHVRVPAGGRIERHHDTLQFKGPGDHMAGNLPVGRYRIVATYDEGRTFRLENRNSRVIRSVPVEIVVTAR